MDIRYQLFRRYLVFVAGLGFIFMAINTLNQRPLNNIIIPLVIFIVSGLLLLLARHESNYTFSRLAFLFGITFIYAPYGYLTSPGSMSAILYIYLLAAFILSVVALKPWEYFFPIALILESLIFLQTELWWPELYYQYNDMAYRIQDISINYVVTGFAVIYTIYYMMRTYNKQNEALYTSSITDSLTGLYNRRYFKDFISNEHARAKKIHRPYSLVFIDLNNFKNINDHHGHLKGDDVLVEFANTLSQHMRASDVCVRFGGDEFILVFPATTKEESEQILARLSQGLEPLLHRYQGDDFGISLGITDSRGKTIDEILSLADDLLYKQKIRNTPSLDYKELGHKLS